MEIDYIALFVTDVMRSLFFYRDVLGFEFTKMPQNDGVEGCSGSLRIGLYSRAWLPKLFGDHGNLPLSGTPFLLSMTVDDLDHTYAALCEHQHNQQEPVNIIAPPQTMPWGQRIIFLTDPDGNLLEIVQRSHPKTG